MTSDNCTVRREAVRGVKRMILNKSRRYTWNGGGGGEKTSMCLCMYLFYPHVFKKLFKVAYQKKKKKGMYVMGPMKI